MSASARRDVLLAKESEEMIKPFPDAGNYEAWVAYRKAKPEDARKKREEGETRKEIRKAGWGRSDTQRLRSANGTSEPTKYMLR